MSPSPAKSPAEAHETPCPLTDVAKEGTCLGNGPIGGKTGPKRPALRYHGGKWRLAPWLISHFPEHRTYTEAFGGGASVLLRKPRSYAEVYNDLDGEVVNFFRVLRDHGGELERLVRLTAFARDEFELSYEPSSNPIEQARRTITRSFMGFGSGGTTGKKTGFRCNSNRSGTTPAHDWANLPQNISRLADRLTGVVIENRPATDVIAQQDSPQALHYVDPPYVAATRDKGADYRHEMSDGEHESLAEFLRGLKGMVIVSGYPSPLYDRLFSGWRTADLAALADGASKRTERLWMNFDAPRRLF